MTLFINGKVFEKTDDIKTIVETAAKLPSGFKETTPPRERDVKQGTLTLNTILKFDKILEFLITSLLSYNEAIQSEKSNYLEKCRDLADLLNSYKTAMIDGLVNPQISATIDDKLKRSIDQLKKLTPLKMDLFHTKMIQVDQLKRAAGEVLSILNPCYLNEEANLDENAYCVDQDHIGISAYQPIGTHSVNECICVMIHDPLTNKTGLAHIPLLSSIESLEILSKRIRPSSDKKNSSLQVRLLGGRYGEPGKTSRELCEEMQNKQDNELFNKESFNEELRAYSNYLVEQCLKFFQESSLCFDLISADIFKKDQPVDVTVDPQTFKIFNKCPMIMNGNSLFIGELSFISNSIKISKAHLSFDLTFSERDKAPYLLNQEQATLYKKIFFGGDITQSAESSTYQLVCNSSIPKNKYPESIRYQTPIMIHNANNVLVEYKKSVMYIVEKLDKKIALLKQEGMEVTGKVKDEIIKIISRNEIHCGPNAEIANQPLVDFINEKLFLIQNHEDEKSAIIDFEELEEFKFPDRQPLEAIEAHFKNQQKFVQNNDQSASSAHANQNTDSNAENQQDVKSQLSSVKMEQLNLEQNKAPAA